MKKVFFAGLLVLAVAFTVSAVPGYAQESGQEGTVVSPEVARLQEADAEFKAYARKLLAEQRANHLGVSGAEESYRSAQKSAYDSMLRSKGIPDNAADAVRASSGAHIW